MNTPQMYQLFQVLVDKLDTQNLPDIPPEQFLLLINLATDEYIQEARKAFEENKKIGEDLSSLVKRVYIAGVIIDDRVKFSYKKAKLDTSVDAVEQTIYYLINGVFKSTWTTEDAIELMGTTEMVYTQQDDITVDDPFNNPQYANKVPVVIEDYAIFAFPPKRLTLQMLVGTAIMKPSLITQTNSSSLPEQLHQTLVKRTVELAQSIINVKKD